MGHYLQDQEIKAWELKEGFSKQLSIAITLIFKTAQHCCNSAFNTVVIRLPLSTKWEVLLFHLVKEDQQHPI